MTDYIITGVILIVIVIALLSIKKKAKSKSSCCGSGAYVAKSRKLTTVAEKKTFRVEGMHCQNCVNRVIEDVQDIPGTSASVNLKNRLVTVSVETPMDDSVIIAAIEKHGYKVIVNDR